MAFEFYKRGQGYYTRLCTAIATGMLSALGCNSLFHKLDVLQSDNKIWFQTGIPLALFLGLIFAIFKVLNTPKYADFLIATEGEMKKVSWATWKEVRTSTVVVIAVLLLMATVLFAVDLSLGFGFDFIYER
jgi:preprotein translocase subunit SecE